MKLSSFLNIFSSKKNKQKKFKIEEISLEEKEMGDIFIKKIKSLRYDFCQKMIDEGYKPSSTVLSELNNILLAEIGRNLLNIEIKNNYIPKNYRDTVNDIDIFKEGLNTVGNRNDKCKQIILLISLMNNNNYLDYKFLKSTQDLNNYINVTSFNNYLHKESAIFSSMIKVRINGTIDFEFKLQGNKNNIFSSCIDLGSDFAHHKDNINNSTNVLKTFNAQRYSLPLDLILELHGDKKESIFASLVDKIDKSELELVNNVMDSNPELLEFILSRLTSHIIINDINEGKITPLQVMTDALKSETAFKQLSIVVLTYYPEVLREMSESDSVKAIDILRDYVNSINLHTSIEKEILSNYTESLKNYFLENTENNILKKLQSKRKNDIIDSVDYVELAKGLNTPQNLQDILVILKGDIESLRKTKISEHDENVIVNLEKSLLKSLNIYMELIELDKDNKEKIADYVEQPVLDILKIVKEIKEVNINNKLSDLMNNKKIVTMKVR